MSDLHLTKNGIPIWGANTVDHFRKSIEIIYGMKDIDAIVVTGDISDDGSKWTYQYADRLFSSLGIPTYLCPGNHDSLKMMFEEYKPSFYQVLPPSSIIKGWKLIMLNSVTPDDMDCSHNRACGYLSEKSIKNLEKELEDEYPTIIALHHPPLEPGGWLNRKLLNNRNTFNTIISNYRNVRLVLYGHIHCFTSIQLGHIIFSSSTSVGFAFDKELPKFQIADKMEGFSLIDVTDDIIIRNILLND